MSNQLENIYKSYHENHLSHAFLIETNDQELCLEDLKKILCRINCEQDYVDYCQKCNLCHLIQTEQLPSLLVIRPDGMTIKKDQVLELKQKFSTKPLFSKYNMYVVLNSERFNFSSANTLLKFIEEPEVGILGFFLTNNKENIIDTIKSRCQIFSNFYEESGVADECILSFAIAYLKKVHISHDLSVLDNREFLTRENFVKEDYLRFFQCIIQIYYLLYKDVMNLSPLPEEYSDLRFLLKKDAAFFLKQLKLVEALEQELGYNVNINLLLDRFVLETRS